MINYMKKQINSCMDIHGALLRLGNNEELYYRILTKYLEDCSCDNYIKAIEEKDYGKAARCIHDLKGVSANLGFVCVERLSGKIVEDLKQKNYQHIESDTKRLAIEANHIIKIIHNFNKNR